jgi:UDP-N-acetyl-2-amino-2-deoxyglucuronate dehydrogenase
LVKGVIYKNKKIMKNFVLIGAAGYIAPRHMNAIKETGNNLIAAYDPSDSVGILDSYFPDCSFFTEFERFDRFIDKWTSINGKIDYFSICSPNYLHDSHIRYALKNESDVICEKPIVLNTNNVNQLINFNKRFKNNIYTILQLRHHPAILNLRKDVKRELHKDPRKKYKVNLKYITSRGKWYSYSWKGDMEKSGGIASNIGVHFFDMLSWIFGTHESLKIMINEKDHCKGILSLKNAEVNWELSTNSSFLPNENDLRTFRSIEVNNKEIEFSEGFTDLHTVTYREILKGNGYNINDARESIEIISKIR